MTINWEEIPEQAMTNFQGGDGITWIRAFSDGMNRIMLVRIQPGCSIGMHTHETNSEIFHVLSGTARVVMDGKVEYIPAGEVHYCPKGHSHSLINNSDADLVVLGVIPELG